MKSKYTFLLIVPIELLLSQMNTTLTRLFTIKMELCMKILAQVRLIFGFPVRIPMKMHFTVIDIIWQRTSKIMTAKYYRNTCKPVSQFFCYWREMLPKLRQNYLLSNLSICISKLQKKSLPIRKHSAGLKSAMFSTAYLKYNPKINCTQAFCC